MTPTTENFSTAVRKGRFLWMDQQSQKQYLSQLKKRIAAGYFSSDKILTSVADEIAPAINDTLDKDLSLHY